MSVTFKVNFGKGIRYASNTRSRVQVRPLNARGLQELQRLVEQEQNEKKESSTPFASKLEWKSPLRIVKYPDPILRAQNLKIKSFDESVSKLANEMFEFMYDDDGVGLAAPQVGVNVRLMVFNETGDKSQKDKQIVLVNPQIISKSKKTTIGEEGCLSFPKIYADVERSTSIKVKAQNEQGKYIRLDLTGFEAVVFQHEYDHLDGVLYHDRMTPQELTKVKDKLIEMEEQFKKKNPTVEFQSVQ
eukprot:TRINITY_DN3963_c0_g2_i1.p1 TRINITY_DN3963_c0_g2~~TRINITY_DN3963_c0_g2_i1.p1  ORF type:complete len:251 (+),score=30.41 TRINITY_DN3963_c0_g2_i1:23-754(+)